jgi:zinc protease|nr:pitrilysin family protein [Kofleriaceae bacterium]
MTPRSLVPVLLIAACGAPAKPEPMPPTTGAPPATDTATPPATTPAVQTTTATTTPAKATKVRTVEGITEYHLDNGLTVLLFPDASQASVTVDINYLVGSRFEGYGETGMAHLLEHMMFKGSPHHRNVLKLNEARGGEANGNTYYDRTTYFETLPASQDNLDWALDMEADRMINAEISADDLKTEFSVVRNEFEADEDSPTNILDERVSEAAFVWHNYGHPTIGSRSDIERVPIPALRKFYEKYYQPDNAVLVIAGKFDAEGALASVGKTFGRIAKPTRVLPATYSVEPVQDGERRVTLSRTGDVYVVEVAYHGVSGDSPDSPAFEAVADIESREPSGRLYKKLVETKLAATISAGSWTFHDPGLITFVATVRDAKNVDKVEKIMLDELDGLGTSKIDDKEIERWRVSQLKELELAMTSSRAIATYLTEFIALGDWRALFAYRDRIAKITPADVQRVAKAYLKQSNRTVGRFVPTKEPERAPLTEAASVADYVKDVKEGTGMSEGEVFAGTLENIDARTQRGELKGGIKTALLPKKTRGAKVELELHLHWGDDKSLQGKATAAELMGAMMSRGTKTKSYQDIADAQDLLKAHVWVASDYEGLTLHIDTLRDKLEPSLDLATEILREPTFPAKELEIVKQEALAQLEQQLKDPESIAFTTLQGIQQPWPKSDPRYHPSTQEQIDEIKKVSIGDIEAFYKEFAGAGKGELVVIGDFDPKAITAKVEAITAGWTTKKPYKRLDEKVFGVAGQQKSVDVKDKENTVVVLGEDISLRDTDPDYAAFMVMNNVLGGGTGSRLWMRIREHEGLTYGVQSWVFAGSLDDAGGIGGYMIVAPQNLAKAKGSLLDEFTKITTGTVTDDELKQAKDTWLKELDTNLSSDSYVAGILENQLFRGRTMDFNKKLKAAVEAVTAADVSRVAKARIKPDKLVVIDVGDKARGAANAAKGGTAQ